MAGIDYAAIYAAGWLTGVVGNQEGATAITLNEGDPPAPTGKFELWIEDPLLDTKPMQFVVTVASLNQMEA